MRWSFSFGKKKEEELSLCESLIRFIKTHQYYSKNFMQKDFRVPENIIVNKKKHRNDELQTAILVTEYPKDENCFILFWVAYQKYDWSYMAKILHHRVINLSEEIPSVHKLEYLVDKCSAENQDDASWDIVETYLPDFKQQMQLGMEKQKETSKEEVKDDSLQLN